MTESETLLHLTLLGEAALNADCAIFVANENGELIAVNEALCDAVGLDREAVMTRRLEELVPPGGYRAVETRVASLPYVFGFFEPEVRSHLGRRR